MAIPPGCRTRNSDAAGYLQSMRICLVTPFAWSQPHDVNEHVAGRRGALCARAATTVTVLAPSTRARRPARRAAGARSRGTPRRRRDRRRPGRPDLAPLADGRAGRRPGEPRARARAGRLRRRPRVRARPAVALVSRAARHRRAHRRDVLSRPTGSATRPRARSARSCSARLDALIALSEPARDAAAERFPGDYRLALARRRPRRSSARRRSGDLIVVELRPNERAVARAVSCSAARAAGLGGGAAAHEAARSRGPRSRATSRGASTCARRATAPSRAALLNEAAIFVPGHRRARRGPARGEGRRLRDRRADRASRSSPSSPPLRRRGSPRTTSCARREAAARRAPRPRRRRSTTSPPSSTRSTRRSRSGAGAPRRAADPLADRAVDRRRPAHAHLLVVRLHGRPGRARRPRRGRRARRDRGHRPQRLRRRARDGRPRARPRPDRHPRRGGEDRRPGRGDRPLPRARDPARHAVRRHDRRDPRAGRPRLRAASVRPHAHDPRAGDAPPPPRRHRRLRGLQRAAPLRRAERRGAPLRPQVRPDDGRRLGRARPPGRRHGRRCGCARSATPRSS